MKMITSDTLDKHNRIMNNPLIQGHTGGAGKLAVCALSRGGEWYLEKRGSRKILAASRNLGSVFDKSQSLVFAWFVFTFFESRNFLPKSLGLGFLIRISVSRILSFATPIIFKGQVGEKFFSPF